MNDLKNSLVLHEMYVFVLIWSDGIVEKVQLKEQCFYVNY